jgi:hypothetical protein
MSSPRTLTPALILVATLIGFAVSSIHIHGTEPATLPEQPSLQEIKILVEQLGDDHFKVREAATAKLIAIGRPAVKAVRAALKSKDAEVQHRARHVLDTIHASVANLIEDLKDDDAAVRKEAAELLEPLGPKAKPAIAALVEALKDKEEPVRDAVLGALLSIDPENKAIADAAPSKARVNGKYSRLLRRLKVPQDLQNYTEFRDYGEYPATDYAGYTKIPAGYWVYVYPHWYIWGEIKRP